MKKYLMTLVCVVLVAAVSVAGTVAFLTDRESVANTFTVGNVDITLDEAAVNTDGTVIENAGRVTSNKYHLIPGQTYIKDPTVTVLKGSEDSYVRLMVTVNYSRELDAIFDAIDEELIEIFNGYDPAVWTLADNQENTDKNTRTYEFRYNNIVDTKSEDQKLDALFDSFTLPGAITGEQLATLVTKDANGEITNQFTITVEGHAIQAATFADAAAAWEAFENQYPTNP